MDIAALPLDHVHEVAFIGRSNVGKSTLLNAIFNNKNIARVSNTPGRTQQINLFSVMAKLYIADLPGYGYAKLSRTAIRTLSTLIRNYLFYRAQLQRVFLLVDSRHGMKTSDFEMLSFLSECGVVAQIILTKIDKISGLELSSVLKEVEQDIKPYAICHNKIIPVGNSPNSAIQSLKEEIYGICTPHTEI